MVELSLIAPVFDEEENLVPLHERVVAALAGYDFELLLVDDGSRDGSAGVIRRLVERDARVRGVFLPRNCGQTSALRAGIEHCRGRLIATLDADLQNDPADLPALLAALGEHDAVVGYRERRRDNVVRRISSRIANRVRSSVTGDGVRDTGCSLKLFRREALLSLPLFEGMHRFLPALLAMHGYRFVEHPVSHHPRLRGRSKYGIWNRLPRSLRDLLAVRWMRARTILPRLGVLYESGKRG
jgi:glycosyltransferase involved in cell wall biosynthesis